MEKIDLLYSPIELNIKGEKGLKTKLGGIFTILALFFFTASFFAFGIDIFYKKEPKIIEVLKNNPSPLFQITPESIAFTLYDQESVIQYEENERKFMAYLEIFRYVGLNRTHERFDIVKCTPEKMKYFNDSIYFSEDKYYCLPNETNIDIYGAFNTYNFSQARIQVDFCKNNTDIENGSIRNNCYSTDFIKKNITERIQMNILMKSVSIVNNDYLNPGKTHIISKMINTDVNTWSRMNVFFRNIEVSTDKGFISSDIENENYQSVDHILTDSIWNNNTDTIFSHIFANGNEIKIHVRSYEKIQDVFALMGGFISLFINISKGFLRFKNHTLIIDLFNKVYRISHNENEERKVII